MSVVADVLLETGYWIPGRTLVRWADEMLRAARPRAARLERRGVFPPFLNRIEELVERVRALEKGTTTESPRPQDLAAAATVHDAAVSYWRQVKQMAKIEFGANPDILARFRTGVRVGSSFPLLANEVERALPLVDEYRSQLAWLGADDDFVRLGWDLCHRLREAANSLREMLDALPPEEREHHTVKGKLYEMTRKLVRIGRLEYAGQPGAEDFNYRAIRKRPRTRNVPRSIRKSRAT